MGRVGNDPINDLCPDKKRWFAVYTKFKCEKYVTEHLIKKGIDAYIPLVTSTKKYQSRIKSYLTPLIYCHTFVNITKAEYVRVLETEYVIKFIKQRKDLISIPDNEILILKHITGEYQDRLSIVNSELEIGEKVEVVSGQLTGLDGRIVDVENQDFVVSLETLGFQVRINLKREHLKPVL